MITYPILYEQNETDFFTMGLGPLTNSISAKVIEERNGSFYFEAEVIVDKDIYPLIQENRIIKVDAGHTLKDQRFRIKKIVPNSKGKAKIYAEHISYLSAELSIKPEVLVNGNGQGALTIWKMNIVESNPFVVFSDVTTQGTTRWRIDNVQNPRQALGGVAGSILDTWGGEYKFDNYNISLLQKRGTTAETVLAYGRNITDLEQERNIAELHTSVYPFAIWRDNDQNEQIITIDGYVVDCANISSYPNRNVLPVDFSSEFQSEEKPTKDKLKKLAESYIKSNEIGVPKPSIKVSFLDLSKTMDYADLAPLEQLNLCDEVLVYYEKLGINTTAKVIRVVWNVLTNTYDEIEIGSKRLTLSTVISDQQMQINEINNQTNHALLAANGKNMVFYGLFGEDGLGEPTATKVGDMWYKPNGDETEFYIWNGTIWEFVMSTAGITEAQEAADAAKEKAETAAGEAATAKETANSAIDEASKAHNEAIEAAADAQAATNRVNSVEAIANEAKSNADTALGNAADAVQKAKDVLEAFEDLDQEVQIEFTKINGELSSKVSQSTFDQLQGTVNVQGSQITQNKNDILLKANQTDVNTLTGRVSVTESSLSTQAGQITAMSSKVENNISQISTLRQDYAGLSSTVSKVENDLDNLNLGVRNYALQTASESLTSVYSFELYDLSKAAFTIEANTEMFFSFDWRVSSPTASSKFRINRVIVFDDNTVQWNNMIGSVGDVLTNVEKGSYSSKWTWASAQAKPIKRIFLNLNQTVSSGSVTIDNLILTMGNKKVSWVPAPEDNTSITEFSNLTQKVNVIQGTVANKAEQSQVTQMANQITSVVSGLEQTNLIHNSEFFDLSEWKFTGNFWLIGSNRYDSYNGSNVLRFNRTGLTSAAWTSARSNYIPVQPGEVISASTVVYSTGEDSMRPDGDLNIAIDFYASEEGSRISTFPAIFNLSKPYEKQFLKRENVIVPEGAKFVILAFHVSKNGNVMFAHPKLVKGSQVGEYTQSTASQSQITQLSTQITSVVTTVGGHTSQISQMSNQITSVVKDVSAIDKTLNWQKITTGVDLNTMTTTGRYFVASGGNTNYPAREGRWFYLTVDNTNGRIKQEYQDDYDIQEKYFRMSNDNGSTWKPWQRVANQSQITQLSDAINLRVQKGDVINQINVSTESILIAGKKIQITGETYISNSVISTAHIKDAAITDAKIGSLSATKINTGTLNAANVNIINLNVDKLVGNISNFISSNWNSINSSIQITGNGMEFYQNSTLEARMTGSGMEFWYGSRKIGKMGESALAGSPSIRGIAMNLESTGDFITWGYAVNSGANYSMMLTLDPRGSFTGVKGIIAGTDIEMRGHYLKGASVVETNSLYCRSGYMNITGLDAPLAFGSRTINSVSYAALQRTSSGTAIAFGTSELYILAGGYYYPWSDYKKLNWFKGRTVYIPTSIGTDGRVNSYNVAYF